MLSDAVTAALPELRAEAESLMSSSCTIREPAAGEPVTDPNTGRVTFPGAVVVYSGPCSVRPASTWGREVDAGGVEMMAAVLQVSVPFGARGIREGMPVTIDTSPDPELVNRALRVRFIPDAGDRITARRLICEEVA